MNKLLYLIGLTKEQEQAVNEAADLLGISISPEGIPVHCRKQGQQKYGFDGKEGHIIYHEDHQFLRGLGVFCEHLKFEKSFCIFEKASYDHLGVMVDCSRNAVLNMDAFKKLVRHLALMGYSDLQLYTEDTYEIKGYPYFGYQRGRYTAEEFHEMDAYARLFSIELVPCIQTLAHLGRALHWETFSGIRDCNDILLVDEENTYKLIDSMFAAMSENLSSRRINIGMDEAHMLGLGKYLDRYGYRDRMDIMMRHFKRVMEIARKYGYKAMMWSDMFFRLVSGGEYFSEDCPIRYDLLDQIPEDISLIYWDYYSTDKKIYDKMLENHLKISSNLVFAGGAWKWTGLCPNAYFSEQVARIAHMSCVEHGVKDVLITTWGDNGAECGLFSVLPAFQAWAELCYGGKIEENEMEQRFHTCTGASYKDFMHLGDASLTPDNPKPGRCGVNPSKYLLYQDILGGLFDAHVLPGLYAEYYKESRRVLAECEKRNPEWGYLFEVQRALCDVLALKSDMGLRLRNAYHSEDKETIALVADKELPDLLERIERLLDALSSQWNQENKIFGLDVLELRFGGLKQRICSAEKRLSAYVDGKISRLDELEGDVLFYDGKSRKNNELSLNPPFWHNIVSAGVVSDM